MGIPDRQRFRLQQGVVTGAVDQRRIIEATQYRVDVQREYEVYLHQAGNRDLVGTCTIEAELAGSHVVAPGFAINFDPSDCEFFGVWDTDDAGIAHLQHVWMTVQGA